MIEIKNLSKAFDKVIMKDFSITFEGGKTSVILGPSGCGKTTLFNILSGLDPHYSGKIKRDEEIGYIFQEDRLVPWLTSRENLNLVNKDASEKEIDSILRRFHLGHRKEAPAKELSGGERQRLSIGRAFLHRGSTLLMDEALRSMDLSLKLSVIREINQTLDIYKKTMVVISHDVREALLLADTIYVLDRDPMRIAERIEITIPKKERYLYHEDMLNIEKQLYKLLLG